MISLLRWVISTIAMIGIIVFAVANRAPVAVQWSPVHDPVELPAFLLALMGLAAGFILGSLLVWLNAAASRKEARQMKKTVKKLEKVLEADKQRTSEILPSPGKIQDYTNGA